MTAVSGWLAAGGPAMYAIVGVGLGLGFLILERLWATEARIAALAGGRQRPPHAQLHAMSLAGLRRLGLIRAGIAVAPLLGLLGTVTGMIRTFAAVLHGAEFAQMGQGIGEALLTTQYGLAVAAPALLAERLLAARMARLGELLDRAGLRCGEDAA